MSACVSLTYGRRWRAGSIAHYLKMRDVQTVAMLCCVLGTKTEQPSSGRQQAIAQLDNTSSVSTSGSPATAADTVAHWTAW